VELARSGIDAVHAGDIGMAEAADEELLARAREDERIVVSLEADFHALLVLSNASGPSVIRIRIEGLHAEPLAALLLRVLALCESELQAGAMVSVDESNVRVRSLPLIR
jgi:predicted nuclease of predicted toxin-antitoxin system